MLSGISLRAYLAGAGLVGLDRPPRAGIPAEHHPVGRLEGQDPRPPALAAVRCPVHDAAAGPRLEHRLGDRRAEHVVLRRLELRFVLATLHDLRLGLHRLRLEGELTEIRAADLRFTLSEARALLEAAGVELSAPALAGLHERTEGWAAGLRLAALSLAGHPDPEGFVAGFSGGDKAVFEGGFLGLVHNRLVRH
jgi:hypothetical protein